MKTQPSLLGERVACDGVFSSRRRPGEGLFPGRRRDPSSVTLRLMTAPERDTFSPREKAVNADGGEGLMSEFAPRVRARHGVSLPSSTFVTGGLGRLASP